ncbi:hypothetical protein SETIT_1G052900v2 [Setaria italica]|uniref:Uncharacterized protein n=1 Tax=Setaria italica TaxID=4555 RepID=K3YZ92_SETIT|nr:hypothetical protein SETIT_1G052900v2 [Setaria italica]
MWVFLNKRHMAGQGRAGKVRCQECEWALLKAACRFCSIGCKLAALPKNLDFTVSFAVLQKNDDHPSAQEGEAGTRAASKQQTAMAAEPLSGQHCGHCKDVPGNI